MDPFTVAIAMQAIGQAANAIGGSGEKKAQAKLTKEQLAQEERARYAQMGQGDKQFGANYNAQRTTMGDSRATQAADLESRLNRAPMADKAQALLMARLGASPAAFQGRDMTRNGTAAFQSAPTGGMGDVLNTMRSAAANYVPGSGGVKSDYLKAALARLGDPSQMPDEYTSDDAINLRLRGLLGDQYAGLATDLRPEEQKKYEQRIQNIGGVVSEYGGGRGDDLWSRIRQGRTTPTTPTGTTRQTVPSRYFNAPGLTFGG